MPVEQHGRTGMPLWAIGAALLSATLSCAAFLARFPLVFSEDYRSLDRVLEWVSYVTFGAAAALPVLGLVVAWKRNGAAGTKRFRKGGKGHKQA